MGEKKCVWGKVDAGWNAELAAALPSCGTWKANHETGKVPVPGSEQWFGCVHQRSHLGYWGSDVGCGMSKVHTWWEYSGPFARGKSLLHPRPQFP